ncbi:MAG: ABC transporter permease [Actinomycetota bacterium]
MRALLSSELLKIRTTRTARALLLAAALLAGAATAGGVLSADARNLDLGTATGVRTVMHGAGTGSMLVLVLGIIGMAGEFRAGTIVDTLLTTPRRGRVMLAKLLVYAGAGLVFGLVAAAASLTVAIPLVQSKGASVDVTSSAVWLTLIGTISWSAIYGAVGVAIGALIRNQAAAIVGALAWIFLVEQLVIGLFEDIGRWLPANAAAALGRAPEKGLLGMAAGAAVLLAYAAGFALTATRLTMRRDVT